MNRFVASGASAALAAAVVLLASACPGVGGGDTVVVGPDGGAVIVNADKKKRDIDPTKYAAYMTRYPFGGRTTEWWSERLTSLKAGPSADAALYALTVERAKANGLVVEEGAGPEGGVLVKPGPELTARLLERMELE